MVSVFFVVSVEKSAAPGQKEENELNKSVVGTEVTVAGPYNPIRGREGAGPRLETIY